MKKLLLALALLCTFTSSGLAQCNGVFPSNTICGNATGGNALPKPVPNSVLTGVPGGTSGQTQYNNSGAFGGYTPSGDVTVNPSTGVETIQPAVVTGAKIASNTVANGNFVPGPANSVKGSLNGSTTSDLVLSSCSALYQFTQWVSGTGWQCGTNAVLPSRAVAASLNLSAFTSVATLGYATPGDGGQSVFKNITTNPVIDSFITSFTITAGSGYTNGSFFGVVWTTGTKSFAVGTATVSGGAVTAVNVAGTPSNQCKVGDVFTSSLAGGSGASITITGCSSPLGSFNDTASNHFQIVPYVFVNAYQFGAVGDWNGTDAGATDNFNSLQAMSWYAGFMNQHNSGNGGFWGSRIILPQGTFMACGAGNVPLIVAYGTIFEGVSSQGSVVKMCDSFNSTTNFVELCDPNWHFACLDSGLRNIQLFATRAAASAAGFAMVHSNNTQDFGGLDHVYLYGGLRQCAFFEKGYGGASTVQIHHVSCSTDSASAQIQIGSVSNNYGTTIINMQDIILGGSSSGGTYQTGSGILILGGFVEVNGVHCESMPVCIEVNNSAAVANGMVSITNINSGSGAPAPACTGQIQLDSTNTVLNTLITMVPQQSSCTNTITNGVSGGNNFLGTVGKTITCPAGTCS